MRTARRASSRWLIAICAIMLLVAGCSGGDDSETIAVLFVGHGEPTAFADGDVALTFPDGTPFGPHAETLGVPADYQFTEWAAAYEEIATAMTYLFGDVNGNGTDREVMVSPDGDVPPFFTWEAFREELNEIYGSFGDLSPHNDLLAEHVENLDLTVDGVEVETHLAFLDAVPRIPDVMWEIADQYDKMVVVPMLLSSSTHTTEVEDQMHEVASLTGGMEIVMAEPFFDVPFMRARIKDAVIAMADYVHQSLPADVADSDVGVLLVAHGTPYVPPHEAFGYREGDIFSNLPLTENLFHDEIAEDLPWPVRTGRMNYSTPSIQESLAAFEADGITHVMVIPSAFPTAAMHTMWDVADPAVGRALTPDEGIVTHTRPSGMNVYYSSEGYADLETGRQEFRSGLGFIAKVGIMELLEGAQAETS